MCVHLSVHLSFLSFNQAQSNPVRHLDDRWHSALERSTVTVRVSFPDLRHFPNLLFYAVICVTIFLKLFS